MSRSTSWLPNWRETCSRRMSEFAASGPGLSALSVMILFLFAPRSALEGGSRRRPEPIMKTAEEHGQEEVEGEDADERGDKRLGGGPANALRPGPRREAAVAADEGNG